jgi:alkylation response protein AidB-like acyl-CoA dehydrogenase
VADDQMMQRARETAGDPIGSLALAAELGTSLPTPGRGQTWRRWQLLAAVAAVDLTVARVLEAHSDALAILAEAGEQPPTGTWGVFAAEAPDVRLEATRSGTEVTLHGTKPWCSLAGQLDHALVTAHVGGDRGLFAVDLRQPGVHAEPPDGWVSRGLAGVPSGPVRFDAVRARPVGEPGWYLRRPGFAWGGIGVAACWLGATRALVETLRTGVGRRDSELDALHVGALDVALFAATTCLREAADRVDAGTCAGRSAEVLALRVRSLIAAAAEQAITRVGHALGPAPLTFDEEHARRVADLQVYVRQHHAERDLAALGRFVVAAGDA